MPALALVSGKSSTSNFTNTNKYMRRRLLCSMILALCALGVQAAESGVCMLVSNPSNNQRQEVVEADLETICQQLGIGLDEPFMVKNAFGQEMTYQKTYDGKLLLDVSVQPHSQASFTITKGEPSVFKSSVKGKVYPERADDITWENDRGIYRVYGPALQRSGERSFGIDVWVKNTPELVVEERYKNHMWGVGQRDSLKRVGKPEEANAIYVATSFHHDHGYGLDCYGVGPSLGCGAPALMKNGQLVFSWCYKAYKILDNGPLRFTVELTYNTSSDGITEHRIINLDKGSHFNRMTVWYDGITQPTTLAAGVVLHDNDHLLLGKQYVLYADPTDNPRVHQTQIYVGPLFPNGIDETLRLEGELPHAIGILRHYSGVAYTYYFGSAWSNYDIHTMVQWQLAADEYLHQLSNPFNIIFKPL